MAADCDSDQAGEVVINLSPKETFGAISASSKRKEIEEEFMDTALSKVVMNLSPEETVKAISASFKRKRIEDEFMDTELIDEKKSIQSGENVLSSQKRKTNVYKNSLQPIICPPLSFTYEKMACLVCGDPLTGFKNVLYPVCQDCKNFFKKSIYKKSSNNRCKYGETCKVEKSLLRKCHQCWLQKCTAVGMRQANAVNKIQEIEEVKKHEYADVKPMCSEEYYTGNMHLEVRHKKIQILDNVHFFSFIISYKIL